MNKTMTECLKFTRPSKNLIKNKRENKVKLIKDNWIEVHINNE